MRQQHLVVDQSAAAFPVGSSIGTAADGIARYLTNFKVRVSGPDVPAGMQALIDEITLAVGRNEADRARDLMLRYVAILRDYIRFVPVLVPQG